MPSDDLEIRLDDLSGAEIAEFIDEHIRELKSISPPESKHALDLDGLRDPGIAVWTVWKNGQLVGCGGIKRLNENQGEIKAMRTHAQFRGEGIAAKLLQHMLTHARDHGITELLLETGSMAFFEPARKLYEKCGFKYCGPFGDYVEDPNSVFMKLSEHV